MRRKFLYLIYMVCVAPCCLAQEARFTPPFDFPIVFSGNFGELRANHFHGGLDFKTGGVTGKQVRALADGHISRIRVTHGSGYVLDVAYDNGYTTINRHLSAFVGDVARRVEALQYEQESWEVEITPEPGEYPVRAGQVIALSGNTGYSFGPHLHLDMLETATGDYIDPLPFFADKVKDHTPPRAESIMIVHKVASSQVASSQVASSQVGNYSTDYLTTDYLTTHTVEAWGTIGVGIRAYDYMDGVHNRYGVKSVVLEVDGEEVFRSTVDRFAYEENRYINSWTHGQYMKSFIDPGNRLRMLHAKNGNRGLIDIDEERPYRFVYTLSDALGNTSQVKFTVVGKCLKDTDNVGTHPGVSYGQANSEVGSKTQLRLLSPDKRGSQEGVDQDASLQGDRQREKYLFHWDRLNYLQEPGLELVIPRGMLYDDVRLNYSVRADSGDIAFTYRLNDTRIPLHDYCRLRIGLRHRPLEDTTKYYVAGISDNGNKYSVGGKYEEGFMVARIRELGTYTVAIDTVPPTLTPVNKVQWGRTGSIVFKAKDPQTGIAAYRGTIDGRYALFGKPNSISGDLVCKLDPRRVERGKKHLLELTVTDHCGNQTTHRSTFFW